MPPITDHYLPHAEYRILSQMLEVAACIGSVESKGGGNKHTNAQHPLTIEYRFNL